jgi:outer membrane protein OmpA-like peptidoglycan-associated protein
MRLGSCLPLVVFLAPAFALAQESVDVSVTSNPKPGQGVPAVHVRINEPIAGFELKLQRSDGHKVQVRGGGEPGVTRTLQLEQPEGRFHYTGELVVVMPDNTRDSMTLDFDTELASRLTMNFNRYKDVDTENRRLVFRLNRPAARAEVKVIMDTGQYAMNDEVRFNGEPPGSPLEVQWPEAPGQVIKIAVRAWDDSKQFVGMEVFPGYVEIAHEDVNFDTGKWEIRSDQEPKLEKSYREISQKLSIYGRTVKTRLYIIGHTDRVGSTDSNRTLSLQRARSIAEWFRRRGVGISAFYYEGFGEQALRVGTPDETPEERNRRAQYLIAVDDPTVEGAPFQPKWRKL